MGAPETFSDFKDQEKEAKKKIIARAALRVFSEKPLQKSSLREIAEKAGISHASIYRYFQDKQALFVEAFLLGAEELIRKMDALIENPPESDLLQEAAGILMNYLTENEHYFMMMSQFMLDGELSPKSLENLNLAMKSFLDRIEAVVRMAGGESGLRYLAHTFFAVINGILITFRNYPGRSRDEVNTHMKTLSLIFVQMFKDGIAAGNYNLHITGGKT